MKRNLILLSLALLSGIFAFGCNSSTGGTVSEANVSNAAPAPSEDANFKTADPTAKAAMDAKRTEEENKAALAKPVTGSTPSATDSTPPPAQQASSPAPGATMPKDGEKVAVLTTNLGVIVFRFMPDKAPKTVENFQTLAGKKFYDGTKFHRVIPDFMIQGGDPNTASGNGIPGQGGPGYTIEDEFSDVSHKRGIVSMANTGQPHSSGCQFFICVGNPTFLDGKYNVFGQVVKGMDVADKIVNLPRNGADMPTPDEAVMKTVRIETWPLKS